MNILFACNTTEGPSKWRAVTPAKYLTKRGHTCDFMAHRTFDLPDAVVFYRSYTNEAVLGLYLWCKERRIRVIYDTDDNYECVDSFNQARSAIDKLSPQLKMLLPYADVVTTTTPQLAERLRKWNPNVAVLPNSVDPEDWTIRPRTPVSQRLLRVGWTGGASHFLDLCQAVEAVSDVQKTRDFTFVIQGLTAAASVNGVYRDLVRSQGKTFIASPFGRAIKTFLTRSSRLRYEFHPCVPLDAHPGKICDLALDLGIAPLTDSTFNRDKSCIKYYEYAMGGAATLASDVLPYSAEVPSLSCNSRKAWGQHLAEIMDADLSAQAAREREWVLDNRNIEQTVALWEQAIQG